MSTENTDRAALVYAAGLEAGRRFIEARALTPEQQERIAELPAENQEFARILTTWMDRVPEECKAMALAGVTLLAAAADGLSTSDNPDTVQWRAGYGTGYQQGQDDERAAIVAAVQQIRAGRAIRPQVYEKPWICNDRSDTEYLGREIGIEYHTSEDDNADAWLCFTNEHQGHDIYLGRHYMPLAEWLALWPGIQALMADKRVQAELKNWRAGNGALPREAHAEEVPVAEEPERRPWHDEPAEWAERIRIAEIDGAPIELVHMWNEERGSGVPYAVACEIGGLRLEVDRHEVTIVGAQVQGCGDVTLSDLGALIELHSAGILPRLIELARAHVPAGE